MKGTDIQRIISDSVQSAVRAAAEAINEELAMYIGEDLRVVGVSPKPYITIDEDGVYFGLFETETDCITVPLSRIVECESRRGANEARSAAALYRQLADEIEAAIAE